MNSNKSFVTKEQYFKLCKKCWEILNSENSKLERIAIPWLHPIREHPIFLDRYKVLFSEKGRLKTKLFFFKNYVRNKLIWIRQIYRAFFGPGSYWYSNGLIQPEVDCLFISHILNPSQLSDIDDFYFSIIPSELVKRKYSIIVGYINRLDLRDRRIQKSIKSSSFTKVYFTNALSLYKEITFRKSLTKESHELKLNAILSPDNFTKDVYNNAANVIFNGESQAMLRLYQQVRRLVQESKPKAIISTYEGHAYERICMAAARSINPNIVCISYQHTGTFKFSNTIKLQFQPQYNPNAIFTSGIECKEVLSKLRTFDNTYIEVLGSNRGMENSNIRESKKNKQFICLVLPEGIISECLLLFKFSLECAILCPDIYYIWRLHPGVTFGELKAIEKRFNNLPSNIILSNLTLEEDIVFSNWVLYRGTTSIFKAIFCGLRPLYFKEREEMTLDPLFDLKVWRVIIDSSHNLLEVIKDDISSDFCTFSYFHDFAMEICRRRFSKIDLDVLDTYLNNNLDFVKRSNLN
jgi:hypothetical protein